MNYHIDVLPYCIQKKDPYALDDDGVLLSKIPYTDTYGHHATAIASHVIATRSKPDLQWLLHNIDEDGAIRHGFIFPHYPMQKGWIGGLAQSLMISAFMQEGYPDHVLLSADALLKHCCKDGVIYEYPQVEILNGWMYGIFGLMDASSISPEYQKKVDMCLTLSKNASLFTTLTAGLPMTIQASLPLPSTIMCISSSLMLWGYIGLGVNMLIIHVSHE